jgi:hypothetical protein
MNRTVIVRTKDDGKVWLVNLDEKNVSELQSDSVGAGVQEAEVVMMASERSSAAAHASATA